MEYEVFLSLFERMRKEKTMRIGDYLLEYTETKYVVWISYSRDGYYLGRDSQDNWNIGEYSSYKDTFKDGINKYDNMIDYLDDLYKENIEEAKMKAKAWEEKINKRIEEEKLKEEKLNQFLGEL